MFARVGSGLFSGRLKKSYEGSNGPQSSTLGNPDAGTFILLGGAVTGAGTMQVLTMLSLLLTFNELWVERIINGSVQIKVWECLLQRMTIGDNSISLTRRMIVVKNALSKELITIGVRRCALIFLSQDLLARDAMRMAVDASECLGWFLFGGWWQSWVSIREMAGMALPKRRGCGTIVVIRSWTGWVPRR